MIGICKNIRSWYRLFHGLFIKMDLASKNVIESIVTILLPLFRLWTTPENTPVCGGGVLGHFDGKNNFLKVVGSKWS